MISMLDNALEKTNEMAVKSKVTSSKDCDQVLIDEYNNGWINVNSLQKISKLVKDATYELVR